MMSDTSAQRKTYLTFKKKSTKKPASKNTSNNKLFVKLTTAFKQCELKFNGSNPCFGVEGNII